MNIDEPFVINHRFLIDPSRHTITNLETQSGSRLEPRHVKLLCLLCIHKRKVVGRDFLIGEIWNNYSGADEALTQGVSLLRKILADEKKELIKTIPKKGYIFGAEIREGWQPLVAQEEPSEKKKGSVWVYSMLTMMVVLSLLLHFLPMGDVEENIKPSNVASEKINPPSASKPISIEEEEISGKHTSPPPEGKDDARKITTGEEEGRNEKHTSPPPEGKDDAKKTTASK